MGQSVFFYVQHLWGVGHVYRATRIARAMAAAGFKVHLIWGGTKIPGFDFAGMDIRYLPAVRTRDASFSQLLHEDYEIFTDEDEAARCKTLLEWFDEISPDILMTEAYPFGRRQMRFELLPLLEHAKTCDEPPLIVSSIRDIMQEGRKEKRVAESVALVRDYYDLVLVHGDKSLIRIEETLQGVAQFEGKVRYTGLVTPEPLAKSDENEFACDVLVTVGGGAFGQNLTRVALEAMKHSKRFPSNWIVSAGTELSAEDFRTLLDNCPEGMRIVRHVPLLADAMRHCEVSVSHAGYNTVADILRAGCNAVLYPYTGGKETEQLRRSQIMAERGVTVHLEPERLTPEHLARAIDEAVDLNPASHGLDLNGAANTARILKQALAGQPGS